jgi:hypothetical protein
MPTREQGYGIAGRRHHPRARHVRMGNDPSTSALNAQLPGARRARTSSWPTAAPFVSQADKNPTWTILALSMRTSDYITDQRKAGAL